MWGYYHAMLRLVFATAILAACHPAAAPTVVHASAPIAAAPITQTSPIRQDFELLDGMARGPLHEVLATGHECRQQQRGPIDDEPVTGPVPGRRLLISVTPIACERHRDGLPVLH
jgi:hypothetical protein